mmetsp:Transcript_22530/g.30807  ORF Transcript_22530/g.30807 Transcript_22530/m.30807 type:complete len:189 (-) Transcript_22530:231-797(-)
MTNLNIILPTEPQLRVFLALVLALGNVKLYSQLDPYIDDTDDIFAEVGKWSTVLMIIFSIILQCGAVKSASSGVGLVLVTLLASVMLFFFGFCLYTISSELAELPAQILKLFSKTTEEKVEEESFSPVANEEDTKEAELTGDDTSPIPSTTRLYESGSTSPKYCFPVSSSNEDEMYMEDTFPMSFVYT